MAALASTAPSPQGGGIDLPTILQHLGSLLGIGGGAPQGASPQPNAATPGPAPSDPGSVLDQLGAGAKTAPLSAGGAVPEASVMPPAAASPSAPSQPSAMDQIGPPPLQNVHRGVVGDVLDDVFLHGAIQAHRRAEYGRELQNYQLERNAAAYGRQPQAVQDALALGGQDAQKSFGPQNTPGGDTLTLFGGARTATAPKLEISPSGVGTTQTPAGTTITGTMPTIQKVGPGETASPIAAIPVPGVRPPQYAPVAAPPQAAATQADALQPRGAQQQQIVQTITQRALAAGLDPHDAQALVAIGQIESGLNPSVSKNGSSTGLYQFHPDTFAKAGGQDINDPSQQIDAAVKLYGQNKVALAQALGRPPTATELYLAHQQGLPGAVALLTADPNASAVTALQGVYGDPKMARAAVANNFGSPTSTVGQFLKTWQGKVQRRMGDAGLALPAASPDQGAAPAASPQPAGLPASLQGKTVTPPVLNPQTETFQQTGPTGAVTEAGKPPFGFAERRGLIDDVSKDPRYTDYIQAATAANGLHEALGSMSENNGVVSNAALDSYVRSMTGGVPRPASVKIFMSHLGLPQEIQSKILEVTGDGSLTPTVLSQMDAVLSAYARAKGSLAQQALSERGNLAKSYGGDLGMTLPPLTPTPDVPWMRARNASIIPPKSAPKGLAGVSPEAIQAELRRRGAIK